MNQLGATAEFFLARITPETAGKTLQLTFWDMADIGGGSATFTLLPPARRRRGGVQLLVQP